MKKFRYIVLLFVVSSVNLFGQQDVHFSQFFASPLTLNPANAGMFTGDLRAIMNYRSQWGSVTEPYVTMAASVDLPVLKKLPGGMFGLGINFFRDQAGDSKMTTTNYALSLAYHLDISGGSNNQFLSMGFQAGSIQRSLSLASLTWNDQWNGADFDRDISTVDQMGANVVNAFDMAAGMNWFYAPDNDKTLFAGLSLFHVHSPNIGFSQNDPLLKKYTLHGGGDINFTGGNTGLLPNFVFVKQGANQYMDIGAEVKIFLQENSKFTNYKNQMYMSIGPYIRWGDAMYLVSRFNWNGLMVSASYDFNLSDLSVASGGNGGFEVMLGYKMDMGLNATRGHRVKFN